MVFIKNYFNLNFSRNYSICKFVEQSLMKIIGKLHKEKTMAKTNKYNIHEDEALAKLVKVQMFI